SPVLLSLPVSPVAPVVGVRPAVLLPVSSPVEGPAEEPLLPSEVSPASGLVQAVKARPRSREAARAELIAAAYRGCVRLSTPAPRRSKPRARSSGPGWSRRARAEIHAGVEPQQPPKRPRAGSVTAWW